MNEDFVQFSQESAELLVLVPSLYSFFLNYFVPRRMLKKTSFSRLSLPSQLSKTRTS